MENKIVTIAAFPDLTKAYIAKNLLQENGIESFIAGENITTADPLFINAVGGIRLNIFESDLEQANAVLSEMSEFREEEINEEPVINAPDSKGPFCPKCGSDDVRKEKVSAQAFALGILVLGFPLPFLKRKTHCFNCGNDWK